MNVVLRFIGSALVACVLIQILAKAVAPLIAVLTVGFFLALVYAVIFARPR